MASEVVDFVATTRRKAKRDAGERYACQMPPIPFQQSIRFRRAAASGFFYSEDLPCCKSKTFPFTIIRT